MFYILHDKHKMIYKQLCFLETYKISSHKSTWLFMQFQEFVLENIYYEVAEKRFFLQQQIL